MLAPGEREVRPVLTDEEGRFAIQPPYVLGPDRGQGGIRLDHRHGGQSQAVGWG